MKCENCQKDHDGSYGSGRFCSAKCARGFSTKDKRQEISEKVSRTFKEKGIRPPEGNLFKCGYDENRFVMTKEHVCLMIEKKRQKYDNLVENGNWDNLTTYLKRKRVLLEQKKSCHNCGLSKWFEEEIRLEIHHIDGNTENNDRSNLVILCPNCHSLTDTWRKKKKK